MQEHAQQWIGVGTGMALLLAGSAATVEGQASQWKRSGAGATLELSLPSATAEPPSRSQWSIKPLSEVLIRCRDHKPQVGLAPGSLAGDKSGSTVKVRFDQEQAKDYLVTAEPLSKDFFGGQINHFANPRTLIEALLAHRSMLVRYASNGGYSKEAAFDLPGLDAVIGDFEQACGIARPFARSSPKGGETAGGPAAVPVAAPAAANLAVGNWSVSQETSKFDDRKTIIATLEADQPWTVRGKLTGTALERTSYSIEPVLVLRCREAVAEAYIVQTRLFSRSPGSVDVKIQFDAVSPQNAELGISEDGKVLFFAKASDLVKKMVGARRLGITFKPIKGDPPPEGEAVFDLTGVDRALGSWLQACPMKL